MVHNINIAYYFGVTFNDYFRVMTVYEMREKGRDLPQSYDKSPTPTRNPKSNVTTQKRRQQLQLYNDYKPT